MNIVQLAPKPKESAISLLGRFLEMAKAGEITDVAISALGKDGLLKAWSIADDPIRMIGALDQLKHDYRMSEVAPLNVRE